MSPAPSGARPRVGLGIRLGVVWLLFTLVYGVVGAAYDLVLSEPLSFDVARLIQSVVAGTVGVVLVVAASRRLDRRSLASLAVTLRRADIRAFLGGGGLWLGLAAVALLAGDTTGAFRVVPGAPTATFWGQLLLQVVLVLSYEAVPEELVFRGYMYTNLAERAPRWLAVLVQALLFTLWAFGVVTIMRWLGATPSWSVNLDRAVLFLTFGLTLALLRMWLGSVWASIGFHLAFQVTMQLLGTDRLVVLDIPPADREIAYIFFWFFTIVIGGVVALVGVIRKGRRRAPTYA